MRIDFQWVEYKNLQSIGNTPIKIELNRNPTTVIGGPNGSGKSSLWVALYYGLFGKVLSNDVKLAGLINSVNKKNLLVKVAFKKGKDDYLVIRGEKPKKFEIYKNDELLDQAANARDQQKMLDIILGMDAHLFTQVMMLNKERFVPFMEMKPAERRKVVEAILDISIFSDMNELCKNMIRDTKTKESTLSRDRDVQQTKLDGQSKLIQEIQDQLAEAKRGHQEEVQAKQEEIEELEKELDAIQKERSELCFDDLEPVNGKVKELSRIGDQIETKIGMKKKDLSFFEDNDNCPTCKQELDNELKQTKIQDFTKEIDELKSVIVDLLDELETNVKEQKKLKETKERHVELTRKEQSLQQQIKYIKSDIDKLEQRENDPENGKLNDALDTYTSMENDLDSISNSLRDTLDEKDQLEEVRNLLKDDGIKATIIREYLAYINKKVNEYLNSMNFFINMSFDEEFNESFGAMHKENFVYGNLSSGQKCRVNLAIWLALLEVASVKNSVVSNFIALDEILEPIDAQGVNDFMNLCKELLTDKHVFVVTQRFSEFEDYFHSSIKFGLNEGFTEIT